MNLTNLLLHSSKLFCCLLCSAISPIWEELEDNVGRIGYIVLTCFNVALQGICALSQNSYIKRYNSQIVLPNPLFRW